MPRLRHTGLRSRCGCSIANSETWHTYYRPLPADAKRLAARLAKLHSQMEGNGIGLETLRSDLQTLRHEIRKPGFPMLAAGEGIFGSGLYVFLGLLALSLARIQNRLPPSERGS